MSEFCLLGRASLIDVKAKNVLGTLSKVKFAETLLRSKEKVCTYCYIRPEAEIGLEATKVTDITWVGGIKIC